MKKFKFKLDKLLDYKTKLLDNEILALATLNSELAAVNGRIDDMSEAARRCRGELLSMQLGGGVYPATCVTYASYEDFLNAEVGKARLLAARLESRIEKQVETIRGLRMETRSMELLRESRLKAYRAEEVKDNERQVEEYVNTARLMKPDFGRA
jgi:flagellar export protein FliJ